MSSISFNQHDSAILAGVLLFPGEVYCDSRAPSLEPRAVGEGSTWERTKNLRSRKLHTLSWSASILGRGTSTRCATRFVGGLKEVLQELVAHEAGGLMIGVCRRGRRGPGPGSSGPRPCPSRHGTRGHKGLNPHSLRLNPHSLRLDPTVCASIPTVCGSIPTVCGSLPGVCALIPTVYGSIPQSAPRSPQSAARSPRSAARSPASTP